MKGKQMLKLVALGLVLVLFAALPAARVRAATCTSTGDGNWSATGTWTGCSGIPQTEDAVVIAAGHTVTVDTDTNSLSSLTVGGTLTFDATSSGRAMTVAGDVAVNTGGALNVATSGSATIHTLAIGGNLSVDGTLNAVSSSRVIDVTFNKIGDQTVSGSGSITFKKIILSKGSVSNKVVASVDLTVGSGAADFDPNNGTWEQSAGTLSKSGGTVDVGASGGLILSGSGSVNITGNASLLNGGILTVNTSGSLTVGNGSNSLETSSGGVTTLTAGTVNIKGRFAQTTASGEMSMTGGSLQIAAGGTVNAGGSAIFWVTNGTFSASGGTISVASPNTNTTLPDINITLTTAVFSGGTFVITTGDTAKTISVNSVVPFYDFEVINGTAAVIAQLRTSSLQVARNLSIASGTLDANGFDMTVGGNWSNSGTFTPGTGTVIFNGGATSTYGGSSTTTFNNLTVNAGTSLDVGSNPIFKADGTLTNNGTIRQTATLNNSNFHFVNVQGTDNADRYTGVQVMTANNLGSSTVKVHGNQNSSGSAGTPVNRWYQIDPTSAGTADLTFHFLCSEVQSGQTPATLKVWRYNGSAWEDLGNSANSGGTCSGSGFVTVSGVSLDTDEKSYVLKINDPLAVALERFTAQLEEDSVVIEWQTVSELEHLGFHIQRREDRETVWTQRTETPIPSPSPGAPEGQSYRWVDRAIAADAFYHYRIDAVDLQGNLHPLRELTLVVGKPFQQWLPAILAPAPAYLP